MYAAQKLLTDRFRLRILLYLGMFVCIADVYTYTYVNHNGIYARFAIFNAIFAI